jgi:hypothetical protein
LLVEGKHVLPLRWWRLAWLGGVRGGEAEAGELVEDRVIVVAEDGHVGRLLVGVLAHLDGEPGQGHVCVAESNRKKGRD